MCVSICKAYPLSSLASFLFPLLSLFRFRWPVSNIFYPNSAAAAVAAAIVPNPRHRVEWTARGYQDNLLIDLVVAAAVFYFFFDRGGGGSGGGSVLGEIEETR